jgi:hypothetical protein
MELSYDTIAWSVTPNPLVWLSSSERWDSNQPLTGTATSTTIVFVFYHQTLQRLSYSVSGGGSGYSPPTFQANQFGSPTPIALTTTPRGYWYDYGSGWSVTPNPLGRSSSSQQWYSTQRLTGVVLNPIFIQFIFQHQYYLTMKVSGPGSVTPSSGWYNAAQKVTITATANQGHKLKSWTGTGTGSYTGTSASYTITMNSAITETATFT